MVTEYVAWFRRWRGFWTPKIRHADETRLQDLAEALGERNGLEWVILPAGERPDGNAPREDS